jgi:hypothetical protein
MRGERERERWEIRDHCLQDWALYYCCNSSSNIAYYNIAISVLYILYIHPILSPIALIDIDTDTQTGGVVT